jgi:hypothetical protein
MLRKLRKRWRAGWHVGDSGEGRKGDNPLHRPDQLGCEGIVSKRLGSPYRSGRSAHWVKVKNRG